MTIARVEIQRAPRKWAPERWVVVIWRQGEPDELPTADQGELFFTAKAARRRARELRREIRPCQVECWCGGRGAAL